MLLSGETGYDNRTIIIGIYHLCTAVLNCPFSYPIIVLILQSAA